jgi:hypothetical protein
MADKWMQKESEREDAAGTKNSLRKSLHVKTGEKIPAKKLTKAAHSKNPKTRKRAALAKVFRKTSHKR